MCGCKKNICFGQREWLDAEEEATSSEARETSRKLVIAGSFCLENKETKDTKKPTQITTTKKVYELFDGILRLKGGFKLISHENYH